MTLGEIIKKYRKDHAMSMDDFAKVSGISKSYISLLEKNKHPKTGKAIAPSIQSIKQASDAMDIDFNRLFNMIDGSVELQPDNSSSDSSENIEYFIVPVLGRIPAGIPREMIPDVIGHEKLFKSEFRDAEDKYFCLQISGHSMEPDIRDGDIVVIHEQEDAEDGEIVIARVDHEDATCKRLKKYRDSIALVPINPDYDPLVFSNQQVVEEPVEILGVVKELRRKI